MDELPNSIHGKRYHLMSLKDPDYFMRMMTSYGKLENLEGSNTHQRYKGSRRELVTKWFNYCEVFLTNFFTLTKLMTAAFIVILLFMWRGPGEKSIGLTVVMLTSWRLQRSMRITCGGTCLMGQT